jgi:hypothetical protein
MAGLTGAYRPEVGIRVGAAAPGGGLNGVLADTSGADAPLDAVVVPLTAGPHPPTLSAIERAVGESGVRARVTEGLGPHPMLVEVLHLRLAEGGFVRADRMRLISVVEAGADMADGVIVGSVGGSEAVESAGVTAVLLAARLGITVLPAPLDDTGQLAAAFARLRDSGSRRPVLAPCLVGGELDEQAVNDLAASNSARACASLGAHSTLAKIIALRYAEVLNSLEADGPKSVEDLPAPTGSRHRPES